MRLCGCMMYAYVAAAAVVVVVIAVIASLVLADVVAVVLLMLLLSCFSPTGRVRGGYVSYLERPVVSGGCNYPRTYL